MQHASIADRSYMPACRISYPAIENISKISLLTPSALNIQQFVYTSCIFISKIIKNNDATYTIFVSAQRKMFTLGLCISK